jgi:hypothetical protein
MSISVNTDQGQFNIPGAYADFGTQETNSGLATTGVVLLIGEADAGPDYTLESDLDVNSFGPDDESSVIAKYGSGPIVDAFKGVVSASKDPDITGAPQLIKIIKTNPSTKASLALPKIGGGTYSTLKDSSYGALGNLFTAAVSAAPAEVLPTTGDVDYAAPTGTVTLKVRVNGGAESTISVLTSTTRDQLVTALAAVPGLSAVAGSGGGGIVISVATGNVVDGYGKSFVIYRSAGPTDIIFKVKGSSTDAGVISTSAIPKLFTSASEYAVTVSLARALDGVSEAVAAGGEVALQIAYLGTTATATINSTSTTLTLTVTGGSGVSQTIDLTKFPTLADLVAYINTLAGYGAYVLPALGAMPPSALDAVTAVGIAASTPTVADATKPAQYPGRIKIDAQRFFDAINSSANMMLDARAAAGLPDVKARTAFAGGARGATSQTVFQSALDTMRYVDGNFVVPLFSQNAAADIALGLTDSGSSYNIDSVNAAVLDHCNQCSKITSRKNRQGFCSKRDTFSNAQTAGQTLAAGRTSLSFLDVISLGQFGLATFQPWMGAAKAAGMQAAAGPKAIFNKLVDVNGALQNAKDFNAKDDSAVIKAGKAGLLVLRKARSGGFRFVADQTTYSKDQNPVWNSIQAIYAADTVSQTSAQRMEDAFVGKTLAQVSSSVALAYLETIMVDMMKLGYLAKSDGAERGYKDAKITISGPHMAVEVTIFLATALYFVTIRFQVNQVQQTSTQ